MQTGNLFLNSSSENDKKSGAAAAAAAAFAAHMGCIWATVSGPYGCPGQRSAVTAPPLTAPYGRYRRNVYDKDSKHLSRLLSRWHIAGDESA